MRWSWSRTKLWEWPLRIISVRPFRCINCRYRDYLLPHRLQLRVRIHLVVPTVMFRLQWLRRGY